MPPHTTTEPPATYRLLTPPPAGSAAIAIVELRGDVDGALSRLNIRPVPIGAAPLRTLAGVDQGVVARPSRGVAYLMPHAGPAVLRQLSAALVAAGIEHDDAPGAAYRGASYRGAAYPEAAGEIEERMLRALWRAASPLAVDLLLDQPRRWSAAAPGSEADPAVLARSAVLNRLISPPLVVALGRPNIGKSSLLNALAGREVAIVADVAGTTRDHVGVALDLGGLVVRYVDAPGLGAEGGADEDSAIQAEAQAIALAAAESADLILLCGDPATPAPVSPHPGVDSFELVLRADLFGGGGAAAVRGAGGALGVSARTGENLGALVSAIRDRLVPPGVLADPGPWRFWSSDPRAMEGARGPNSGPTERPPAG